MFFRDSAGSDSLARNSADVALLVVSGSIGGSCGIAFVNGYKHGITLGWVAKNCQRIVAAHEVGHMFGCAHNRGKNSFDPDGGYEYGNLLKDANDKGYVTVMAYKDTANGYTIRSYKFSSPDLLIQGVPTGSADTDVKYEENSGVARRENEKHDRDYITIAEKHTWSENR